MRHLVGDAGLEPVDGREVDAERERRRPVGRRRLALVLLVAAVEEQQRDVATGERLVTPDRAVPTPLLSWSSRRPEVRVRHVITHLVPNRAVALVHEPRLDARAGVVPTAPLLSW